MSNFGGCFDTGFVENEDPSEEYRQRAEPVLKEHMMYAGRRLANLIMDIYAEDTQVEAPIAFLAWTQQERKWSNRSSLTQSILYTGVSQVL